MAYVHYGQLGGFDFQPFSELISKLEVGLLWPLQPPNFLLPFPDHYKISSLYCFWNRIFLKIEKKVLMKSCENKT